MSAYATVAQVAAGFRTLDSEEQVRASSLLEEAAVLIDAAASSASGEAKRVVSCRMVRRALGDGDAMGGFPLGTNQGTMSAGGYSQQFTLATGGAMGELYIGKTERMLLGLGNRIGARSPVETLAAIDGTCCM